MAALLRPLVRCGGSSGGTGSSGRRSALCLVPAPVGLLARRRAVPFAPADAALFPLALLVARAARLRCSHARIVAGRYCVLLGGGWQSGANVPRALEQGPGLIALLWLRLFQRMPEVVHNSAHRWMTWSESNFHNGEGAPEQGKRRGCIAFCSKEVGQGIETVPSAFVIGTKSSFANRQGAFQQGPSRRQVAKCTEGFAQAGKRRKHLANVAVSWRGFADGQQLLKQWQRLGIPLLFDKRIRETIHAQDRIGMIWASHCLVDGEGALEQGQGLCILALVGQRYTPFSQRTSFRFLFYIRVRVQVVNGHRALEEDDGLGV